MDGTGSPGFFAAVAVEGDRVSIHRGDLPGLEAARTIDASGYVVCPGFVDLHSHAGLTILGEPHHDPKVRQGVTTELVGIDGISHAPFKTREELERYIWLDSGLNGYPPLPADWLTVAQLLDKYDNSVAINMAYILGNSPVRIWSVGWNDRPATPAEMEDMKAVTREAMEEGAWGLSTGLDYPPGSYASTEELGRTGRRRSPDGRPLPHPHPSQPALAGADGPVGGGVTNWAGWATAQCTLTHYRQGASGVGSHSRLPWVWWRGVATREWTSLSTATPIPIPARR